MSSRWEGFPLAPYEGLASGATVVGPALTGLIAATEAGPYGTIATRRDAAGLSAALEAEAAAWDRGDRDATQIAGHWRERLDRRVVARQFAELLGVDARGAQPGGLVGALKAARRPCRAGSAVAAEPPAREVDQAAQATAEARDGGTPRRARAPGRNGRRPHMTRSRTARATPPTRPSGPAARRENSMPLRTRR